MQEIPKDLKYTPEHEWAKWDGKTVTVGITAHAQQSLGDIVYVELPKVGRQLKKGEAFGVVESIKAVSDLYSPAEGKVLEINESLKDDPALMNQDPYGGAWLIKLEGTGTQPEGLLNAESYSKHVENLK